MLPSAQPHSTPQKQTPNVPYWQCKSPRKNIPHLTPPRQIGAPPPRGTSPISPPSLTQLRKSARDPGSSELQIPVTSKLVERDGNRYFSCGAVSMTGFRENMEDAHAISCGQDWGFFAVFDGHNGPHCATFCSQQFPLEIAAAKPPVAAQQLEEIILAVDDKYTSTMPPGGSTAAMVIATPVQGGNRFAVQIAHVGDSRVLIANSKGGVRHATTDHKPGLVRERLRIEKYGGTVRGGRVDGRLAMSRAMGDGEFKIGRPNPLERRLTAQPDITTITCESDDVVIIACDGIFENGFEDDLVVKFTTEQLKETTDLGKVASRLCDESLRRGSSDNITAMVLQFKDGTKTAGQREFVPGPFFPRNPQDQKFRKAYHTMAEKAGLSLESSLDLRYKQLIEDLSSTLVNGPSIATETKPQPSQQSDIVAEMKEVRSERGFTYEEIKETIDRSVRQLLTPEKYEQMCHQISVQIAAIICEMQKHEAEAPTVLAPTHTTSSNNSSHSSIPFQHQPRGATPTPPTNNNNNTFNLQNTTYMNLSNLNAADMQFALDPRVDLSIPNQMPTSSFDQFLYSAVQQATRQQQNKQNQLVPTTRGGINPQFNFNFFANNNAGNYNMSPRSQQRAQRSFFGNNNNNNNNNNMFQSGGTSGGGPSLSQILQRIAMAAQNPNVPTTPQQFNPVSPGRSQYAHMPQSPSNSYGNNNNNLNNNTPRRGTPPNLFGGNNFNVGHPMNTVTPQSFNLNSSRGSSPFQQRPATVPNNVAQLFQQQPQSPIPPMFRSSSPTRHTVQTPTFSNHFNNTQFGHLGGMASQRGATSYNLPQTASGGFNNLNSFGSNFQAPTIPQPGINFGGGASLNNNTQLQRRLSQGNQFMGAPNSGANFMRW